eukprot:GFYU01001677.1.p1 GENE.GFYU01001677.1~~GFYU01001677.1.p1  ORF type:complete len:808 (-),score=215.27 GFYU01001677.1:64-2487(-)
MTANAGQGDSAHAESTAKMSPVKAKSRKETAPGIDVGENATMMFTVHGDNIKVTSASDGLVRLTGYSVPEILHQDAPFLKSWEAIRAVIQEPISTAVTIPCARKDDSAFWNHMVLIPIKDATEAVSSWVANMSDVTRSMMFSAEGQAMLGNAQADDTLDLESGGKMMSRAHTINRLENRNPATLVFDDLRYSVKVQLDKKDVPTTKHVLKGVSGEVKPGEVLCLLGPSGSGKTSLLSILSGRVTQNVEGTLTINDSKITKASKRFMGYVLQDDVFFPHLTVRETLTFTALLRLPKTLTKQEKLSRVDDVLDMLNIRKCADTIVGNMFTRGISGGERKRLNIGCELLTNPSLLILDEPTSGLDSSTALTIIKTLNELAKAGRTIITSLHQPSSEMYDNFDKTMLLADGHTVYYGKADQATNYFASIGYPCSARYNPADFLISLVTSEDLFETEPIREKLIEAYANTKSPYALVHRSSSASRMDGRSELDSEEERDLEMSVATSKVDVDMTDSEDHSESTKGYSKWEATWWEQVTILGTRCFKQKRGESMTGIVNFQIAAITAIVSLFWFQVDRNEAHIEDKVGMLFFVSVFWGFIPMFNALSSFPVEKNVIARERQSGSYRLSAYFVAKSVSEIPIELVYPFAMVTVVYFATGLRLDAGSYFSVVAFLLLGVLTSQSVGLLISTLVMDLKKAMILSGVLMLGMMLAGGWYVDSDNVPVFVSWVRYLSFVSYSFNGLALIEFDNNDEYGCSHSIAASSFTRCPILGTDIIKHTQLQFTMGECLGGLFAIGIGCRYASYLALRYLNQNRK